MDTGSWEAALQARDDLTVYGDNDIGLFALALRFAIDDIHSVASDSITDGGDDKKCDIVYVGLEDGVAIIAQCYQSRKMHAAAPANKAADLNTAVSWLLNSQMKRLPIRLRSAATELRAAIKDGTIQRVEAWYVHNLPEHQNVEAELITVEDTLSAAVSTLCPSANIAVAALEIGRGKLTEWYEDTLSPILVNDEITFECPDGFDLQTASWQSYVTAISARELSKLFRKYRAKLFSANVRDYLGSRRSDANINNGIKKTAEQSPGNFWVCNNGITVLTHGYKMSKAKDRTRLVVKGISIVNGAQTTGALGSLKKLPDTSARVPARFVSTTDDNLIYEIIQFNNSQNKVSASDFRSTDKIQKRLRTEVETIPNAKYEGGRRGGYKDIISRNKNLLPSYTVGQALAAFAQDPIVAYNQKSKIWVSDTLYAKYFNDQTTGRHIVLAYGLLRAVEDAKKSLVVKSSSTDALTLQESALLEYFRHRGSTYLFASAVAACVEVFLGSPVPNPLRLSFGPKVSPLAATQAWEPIVTAVSPLTSQLMNALNDGLKSMERAGTAINTFRSLVQATVASNTSIYKAFAKKVTQDK